MLYAEVLFGADIAIVLSCVEKNAHMRKPLTYYVATEEVG
jgi:hypothetical protein